MALLIVNADDFGLTEATSESILRCHRDGIVTSTSLLALAPGFDRSARLLPEHPELGVGVHLALVGEDPPLLTASEIPSLVDARGRLPGSWREFLGRAFRGLIDADDIERELAAQVDRCLDTGATLTHLDSHQHLHQWPPLWPIIRRLARRAGVDAVRSTRDRRWGALSQLGRLTAARAGRAGLLTTDRFAGFSESGHLDESNLARILASLPRDGSIEIGCHPGAAVDPARSRYRWGFEWAAEQAALTSPRIRRLISLRDDRLGTFGDLR